MTEHARADALLDFWFGHAALEPSAARERNKTWFQAPPSFDALLRSRYVDLPYRLSAGEFPDWGSAPRTALARIVALDQVPRNVFRGTPAAFAFDLLAQEAAIAAVEQEFDRALHPIEAVFVYLPFEHAEDRDLQQRSIELFAGLRSRSPAALDDLFDSYVDYAHRHAKVIAQFGRFPHRNTTLRRAETPAEAAYLAGGGQRF